MTNRLYYAPLETVDHYEARMAAWVSYVLPNGTLAPVRYELCRRAPFIDFTLANGQIVSIPLAEAN